MRTGAAVIATNGARLPVVALALVLAAPASASTAPEAGSARYLWNLSTATGAIRTSSHGLSFDPAGREVLVTGGDVVRIFQANGMEDFSFSISGMMERVLSAGVLGEGGDIVLLGMTGQRWSLLRTSFRGEPIGPIEPKNVPEGFLADFFPSTARIHGARIYLADFQHLRVLVLEQDGDVARAIDLAKVIGLDPRKVGDVQLSGFGVDGDGGLLFTVAVLFKAYALPPSGEVREWGSPGGAPGLFNVASGIAADERNYYVADQLKCAVIAFDRGSLEFVEEFGYRRVQAEGGLIGPTQVAAGDGKVFVSQNANRGVAVFAAPGAHRNVAVGLSAVGAVGAAFTAGEAATQ